MRTSMKYGRLLLYGCILSVVMFVLYAFQLFPFNVWWLSDKEAIVIANRFIEEHELDLTGTPRISNGTGSSHDKYKSKKLEYDNGFIVVGSKFRKVRWFLIHTEENLKSKGGINLPSPGSFSKGINIVDSEIKEFGINNCLSSKSQIGVNIGAGYADVLIVTDDYGPIGMAVSTSSGKTSELNLFLGSKACLDSGKASAIDWDRPIKAYESAYVSVIPIVSKYSYVQYIVQITVGPDQGKEYSVSVILDTLEKWNVSESQYEEGKKRWHEAGEPPSNIRIDMDPIAFQVSNFSYESNEVSIP